ncbi:radical SAM protein [candidate division KSB1 bacterium]|nr:radical SAM protein [candidate division KSB1 bacterium]
MITDRPKILLVNPAIYDFSAYDFWIKPLGLLQIGAVLRRLGYEVSLVDCLDRHHPLVRHNIKCYDMQDRADGSGKFHREELEKPPVLADIPRKYCRYGAPPDVVEQMIQSVPRPDVILLTTGMTYWYPAVRDMANMLRQHFGNTPIVLGGWYATLCPSHARTMVNPSFIIRGEGEEQAIRLIAELTGGPGADFHYETLDELPYPAFDLYPALHSVPILTSRGCPYRCSFCASHLLLKSYRRRSPDAVAAEIRFWRDKFDIRHFAFYDDALLHNSESYAKPIFRLLAEEGDKVFFYTPNGLQPRHIDAEMATLLYQAGVAQLHLSFESASPERQKAMALKVTNRQLRSAVENLFRAGYANSQIGVYVLMGLPDQTMDEVRRSVDYVHHLGVKINLASFSPIPGTREWQRAAEMGVWQQEQDLLLGNNSLFPIWRQKYGCKACLDMTLWVKRINQTISDV